MAFRATGLQPTSCAGATRSRGELAHVARDRRQCRVAYLGLRRCVMSGTLAQFAIGCRGVPAWRDCWTCMDHRLFANARTAPNNACTLRTSHSPSRASRSLQPCPNFSSCPTLRIPSWSRRRAVEPPAWRARRLCAGARTRRLGLGGTRCYVSDHAAPASGSGVAQRSLLPTGASGHDFCDGRAIVWLRDEDAEMRRESRSRSTPRWSCAAWSLPIFARGACRR